MLAASATLTPKDPADVVEYVIEVDGLGDDTISGVTVTGSGVTIAPSPAPSFTDTSFTFWVSGGAIGVDATARAILTTAAGRTLGRTLLIPIRTL